MKTFIVGLLLAGVSGLTIVAFRYHHGFVKLFPYLLAFVTVLFLGFSVWHFAIEYSDVFTRDLVSYLTHSLQIVPAVSVSAAYLECW